jgi:hypothetical protein
MKKWIPGSMLILTLAQYSDVVRRKVKLPSALD